MADETFALHQLVARDRRYPIEAYFFVRDALSYAADSMELSNQYRHETEVYESAEEHHLTGQQLCEAIREFALNQFGLMARIVLKNWGIVSTSCFGDIVYNMIEIGLMKKSDQDRRSHFNDVYEFEPAFDEQFEICSSLVKRRV
ncbi:Minf_1886 family protein [Mariniblastus fucicola]|uniref:Uncharacterized protein n=1 Tax=Mariniblastus fucicola TaxID=980251 RepID=A0A5B9PCH6_9BACT|nr:Minf_1886 family protein [Mariniblastus fucicola]QEG20843.1 hypothetical protein MFFC18_06940 [Mariniblastus fucicola]